MNILRKLLEFEDEIDTEQIKSRLYIPTSCNPIKLLPPDEVCYKDTSYDDEDDRDDDFCVDEDEPPIYLVHSEVPLQMAKRFGVGSLTKRLAGADEIGGIKQTGQHEPITLRLKNILRDGYQPESIPKEMVQNAEDAGASEVKFLLDMRSNRSAMKKLLDPAMKEVQGPALWVFNDAVFTEADLENITKLGGATKSEDRSKIGQFGLGFNAVYHITDVPSFVTNDVLTIFDPHKSHLQSHFRGEGSGIQLNFKRNPSRIRRFQDQFIPYEGIFGCRMLKGNNEPELYQHTLFRLPLRTEREARKSDICGDSYNEEKMKSLLRSLCQTSCKMLLFTENVKSISVYLLNKDNVQKLSLLYKVTKSTLNEATTVTSFKQAVHTSVTKRRVDALPPNNACEVRFDCQWSRVGIDYFKLGKQKLKFQEKWLVTWSAGKGQAFNVCLEEIGMKSGLIPCGGVAWSTNFMESGGVFCFLPLSVPSSGLPVCINGSFAVALDRRSLWRESETESFSQTAVFKTRWNQILCKDVIVSAYITLLQQTVVQKHVNIHEDYLSLWPNPLQTSKNSDYGAVTTGFYGAVICGVSGEIPPKVFLKKSRLHSIDEVIFTVFAIQGDSKMFPIVERVVKQMTSKEVVKVPEWVMSGFDEAGYLSEITNITYSWERIFREIFLPNFRHLQDRDILDLLSHALSVHDDTVLDLMRSSECIPTSRKTSCGRLIYKKPSSLYDPIRFKDIFSEDEGVFPDDQFLKALKMRQKETLKEIGCLKDDLSWEHVLERTKTVQSVWDREMNTDAARSRVKALVNFMDHKLKVSRDGHQHVQRSLREVAFLPAVCNESVKLQCPNNVYLPEEGDLVGYVCPILDTSGKDCKLSLSLPVKRLLGMQETKVKSADVIKNLNHLKLKHQSHSAPDNLQFQCNAIYLFLQKHVKDKEVLQFIQQEEWFLMEKGFIASTKLSFCGETFPPYLYKVPKHVGQKFSTLLRTAGAKDNFDFYDLMQTLATIQESQQRRLGAKVVSDILTKVVKPLFDIADEIPSDLIPQILLPDSKNTLQASSTLSFCDLDSFQHLMNEYNLCHKEIPLPWARKLGVRDIREQMLTNYSHSLPGYQGIGERFGQREELVTRITRIMEGYPLDFTVLKEFVQNADDAKATKVHFVLDNRKYPTQKLFYTSMSELQGPALLAFNDRPFTDDDIKGIQRLGTGNKGEDTDKMGRYGVGFNVVYHLTDCPMFLSGGNTLCIFDPTLKYVPNADEVCPGRMFRPIDEKMLTTYADVFNCFFSFHKDFELQKGTLFRFPLRLKKSKISGKVLPSRIDTLFSDFKKEMFDVLLFLKNVTEISLSTSKSNGKLDNTYTVKAELLPTDANAHKMFFQKMSRVKDNSLLNIPVSDAQYQQRIVDNEGHYQVWLVHQRMGFVNKDKIPTQVDKSGMKMLPKGGVAARCFSLEENASQDDRVFHGRAYCFLPLPVRTNLPVHVDGYFALGHEARRNLWEEPPGDPKSDWNRLIAKEIIAPVYVKIIENMKTIFDRFSDRRTDMDNMREKLQDYHRLFPLHYRSPVSDFWGEVSQAFYQRIILEKYMLFPVLQPKYQLKGIRQISARKSNQNEFSLMWKSCVSQEDGEGFFDDLHQQIQEDQGREDGESQHTQLRLLLLKLGFPLLESPFELYEIMESIVNTMKDQGVTILKVNPKCVECFLKTKAKSSTLGGLPMKLDKTLITSKEKLKLLLKYIIKTPNMKLNGLPMLLTNDGVLREFNTQRKVFHSQHYILLQKHSEQFLHHQFLSLLDRRDECFAEFEVSDLYEKLPSYLPRNKFCTGEYTSWDQCRGTKLFTPTREWIKNLWKFLHEKSSDNTALLQYFGDWSILPATARNRMYLVPMKLAKTVLISNKSTYHEELSNVLRQLHAPVIESLKTPSDRFIAPFASSLDEVKDVLHVFKRLVKVNLDGFKTLQRNDHECILRYFSYYSHNFRQLNLQYFNREILTVLKSLPCHETIHGEFIPLADKTIFSVSMTDVPKRHQNTWISKSNCLFIKKKANLGDLYAVLGIKDISDCELYSRFILPCYREFSSEAQWDHLSRIMVMVNSDPNPKDIVAKLSLKDIPLIPVEGGEVDYASSFHDFENPVFKEMSEKKYFPPKYPRQTDQTSWYEFLRLIGMQKDVNCEQFLQFANKVRLEQKYSKQEKVLVEYLFESHHLHVDRNFISNLAKLAFISAASVKRELSELHKQCSIRKVTFSAVSIEHQNLVWSKEPLLPRWVKFTTCAMCGNYLEHALLKSKQPALKNVLEHTGILCTSLAKVDAASPKSKKQQAVQHEGLLKKVMKDILTYLSQKCEKVRNSDPCEDQQTCCSTCTEIASALGDVPIVPLKGRKLFKAKRLTKSMPPEEENKLFLFLAELPEEFMAYSKLLYCLGATKQPSLLQYADTLKLIKTQSLDSQLKSNPNLIPAAEIAQQGFFRCLSKEEAKVNDIDTVFLISNDTTHTLIESTELYYNDKPAYAPRLSGFQYPMMKVLNEGSNPKFCLSLEKLVAKMGRLKPQLISQNVEEVESAHNVRSQKSSCSCSYSEKLRKVLSWHVFPRALKILLANEGVSDVTDTHKEIFTTKYTVICSDMILTELRMTSGDVISSSQKDVGVLFKRKGYGQINILLSHNRKKSLIEYQIAQGFTQIFNNFLKDTERLQVVFRSESEDKVISDLRDIGLETAECDIEGMLKKPVLGSIIEEDIICLLIQDPFSTYFPTEYVAYNDTHGDSEHFVYAQIVKKKDSATTGTSSSDSSDFIVTYIVDVGGEKLKEVKSVWLFKFPLCRENYAFSENDDHVDPQTPSSSSTEVVLYEKTHEHQDNEEFNDLGKTKKAVTEMIEAAWKQNDPIRRTLLRRLMRKWHPDKHTGEHARFAEEIFKHIQREIDRLENGIPSGVDSSDDVGSWARKNTSQQKRYWKRFGTGGYGRRGRWYGRRQQSDYENFGNSSRGRSYGHFYTPPSFHATKQEAYRWLRQAHIDIDVAANVVKQSVPYYQWKSSLCFFAVEKSVVAARLFCGCRIDDDQDIMDGAMQIRHHLDVTPFVQQLVQIVKKSSHYPNSCSHPRIPHEVFSREHADKVMQIALSVIGKIDKYIKGV
ncbi:Sacsin [Holothuria leucospilota]|uniref:Sacsin n=1 Tax=Holothuria leucospilota TaxID=206669 RepID=A0A9Q1BHK7_HOLLE|nr:Sacsin [Holothuria leucospilota]